jgi:DNA polymerase-3 subunit epsilon
VVDVETTGTRAGHGDRVTEIAVVAVHEGNVQVAFASLVNPERAIPSFVTQLTQITDAMVRDQPTFGELADEVLAALAGRVFVAHNVRFDWGFVARELRRTRDLDLEGPRLCTVQLARRLLPGLRHRNLDAVATYFGVEIAQRHRAQDDALATAAVLRRLLDLARERGAETLDDLTRLGRRARRRRSALPTPVAEA